MKVKVDQELCISCGTCIDMCPDVFNWNDEGKAEVIIETVPSELEEDVEEAVEFCPTEAILEE